MKSAKLFLLGMYIHILLSILVPGTILFFNRTWNRIGIFLFIFYIIMIAVVLVTGGVCVGMAWIAYKNEDDQKLKKSWKLLKLGSIPFFVINFFYSLFMWTIIVAASRGFYALFLPIPIIITYLMIFDCGCVGIFYLMSLHELPENRDKNFLPHYLMQLLPVLDVVDTIIVLLKYKEEYR